MLAAMAGALYLNVYIASLRDYTHAKEFDTIPVVRGTTPTTNQEAYSQEEAQAQNRAAATEAGGSRPQPAPGNPYQTTLSPGDRDL